MLYFRVARFPILRTNHKWPHSSTLIVFLCENELFQRGWGVFVTLVEIPKGWGVISSLQKWKIQRGGGVLSEIPSVAGVWIFSGTTHCWFIVSWLLLGKQICTWPQLLNRNQLWLSSLSHWCHVFWCWRAGLASAHQWWTKKHIP